MAKYLLRGHESEAANLAKASRNPLVRMQVRFEESFERFRDRYHGWLERCLNHRRAFLLAFIVGCVISVAGLVPFLGRDFFPSVDAGQFKLHVRARTGTRIEETARLCDLVEQSIRQQIPQKELGNIIDNIGLPFSGINMAYQNTGTIGPEDGDALMPSSPLPRSCDISITAGPLLP